MILAASSVESDLGDWVLLALIGASLVVLVGKRPFPHRSKGLVSAAVGLLFWVMVVASNYSNRIAAVNMSLEWLLVLRAAALSITVSWLFRGYGFISILAFAYVVIPEQRYKNGIWRMAVEYPPRRWWLLPLGIFVAFGGVLPCLVYLTLPR